MENNVLERPSFWLTCLGVVGAIGLGVACILMPPLGIAVGTAATVFYVVGGISLGVGGGTYSGCRVSIF